MTTRVMPLFERLPEIHRTRDGEAERPDQLKAFLGLIDEAFTAIHEDIWHLYDDLFVETASDWAVPYIGDLLGTSHLAGEPWTIRADVADTIALRRRKGTLAAVELLTFDLTHWGIHAVELRENLAWSQHLNHLRPDLASGLGLGGPGSGLAAPQRGGTVTVRDPAVLGLIGSPFDPFAHLADLRPPTTGAIRYNLPNLAIFLWRLVPYRIKESRPGAIAVRTPTLGPGTPPNTAKRLVALEVDPLGRPIRLFNGGGASRSRRLGCCEPDDTEASSLTELDQTPGPILPARLTDDSPAGRPKAYVAVEAYDASSGSIVTDLPEALQLHVPRDRFPDEPWRFRGANLCVWEAGLDAPLMDREIAIDPVIGRVLIGVANQGEAAALRRQLLLTFTYGAVGPVGAHPVQRDPALDLWNDESVTVVSVRLDTSTTALQDALGGLDVIQEPMVIEIEDSYVHDLDLAAVGGTTTEAGGPNLVLGRTVIIRAADGHRPIIRLAQPLRVRPAEVVAATPANQDEVDGRNDHLELHLEGLFLTRAPGFTPGDPLVARVALNALVLDGCSLDPGGYRRLDGTRAPLLPSIDLRTGHGFATAAEATAFRQTPRVEIRSSIVGAIRADDDYELEIVDSIVDAGAGPADLIAGLAVGAATDPVSGWGPPLSVDAATFLGQVRVERIAPDRPRKSGSARGGIWTQALQVHDDQHGCIKLSRFAGIGDRLPQNVECVSGEGARLRFVSIAFGDAAYCQLARTCDFRILERGPNDDEMGAYGRLREAHKWRNLQIRYREFMPLGIRPLLIPAT